MSTRTNSGDTRRELVADSAIGIIARDGLRALTHRAVDRAAGIPQGSTSHQARTRLALLELVVDTLAARAITDARNAADTIAAAPTDRRQMTVPELADILGTLVDTLARRRNDMKARYALILELDDLSDLQGKLTTRSEVHTITRGVTARLLAAAGLPAPDDRVEELISLTDSLVFGRTVDAGAAAPRSVLTAYLHGVAATSSDRTITARDVP